MTDQNQFPKHDRLPFIKHEVLAEVLGGMATRGDFTTLEQCALLQAANAAEATAKRRAQAIADLPVTATLREVKQARSERAVRRGKDVFLPAWSELCSAMPNLLLRSGLWNVRATRHACIEENELFLSEDDLDGTPESVPSLGDVTLINRGPALGSFDRQVFSACLDYYRTDRPLAPGGADNWIEVSYFKFITGRGSSYSTDGHRALRASLERLRLMSLFVRHDGQDIQLPRVLEASFADGKARGTAPQASDSIFFRVLAPFAALYGPKKWTAVPHDAINAGTGLKSWLACFYSTHSKSFSTKIEALHLLCASSAPLPKFKVQLRSALKELSSKTQPLSTRVASFAMDGKTVSVCMAAWQKRDSNVQGRTDGHGAASTPEGLE